MTTLRSGQFAGTPIVSLPTGYMVWCVENDKLKKQWQEFQTELVFRQNANAKNEQAEPAWHESIRSEQWFIDLDDDSQKRYKSMITSGAWNWSPKQKKHVDAMARLGQVLTTLASMYPTADNDDSGYNEIFDAPRLATTDEINEAWNKEREAKAKKAKLVELLKKADDDYPVPTREDVMPKKHYTADDIIDRIRSKNSRTQQAMVYGSLLNQLTSVADLISEQEQHFDIWEMRDLEWHLNSVKNRIHWLLQQREDI
jgi:hypothetical protein